MWTIYCFLIAIVYAIEKKMTHFFIVCLVFTFFFSFSYPKISEIVESEIIFSNSLRQIFIPVRPNDTKETTTRPETTNSKFSWLLSDFILFYTFSGFLNFSGTKSIIKKKKKKKLWPRNSCVFFFLVDPRIVLFWFFTFFFAWEIREKMKKKMFILSFFFLSHTSTS